MKDKDELIKNQALHIAFMREELAGLNRDLANEKERSATWYQKAKEMSDGLTRYENTIANLEACNKRQFDIITDNQTEIGHLNDHLNRVAYEHNDLKKAHEKQSTVMNDRGAEISDLKKENVNLTNQVQQLVCLVEAETAKNYFYMKYQKEVGPKLNLIYGIMNEILEV